MMVSVFFDFTFLFMSLCACYFQLGCVALCYSWSEKTLLNWLSSPLLGWVFFVFHSSALAVCFQFSLIWYIVDPSFVSLFCNSEKLFLLIYWVVLIISVSWMLLFIQIADFLRGVPACPSSQWFQRINDFFAPFVFVCELYVMCTYLSVHTICGLISFPDIVLMGYLLLNKSLLHRALLNGRCHYKWAVSSVFLTHGCRSSFHGFSIFTVSLL